MRMRPFWIALGFLFVPSLASADAHRWGFYGAGSFAAASKLVGFHTTVDAGIGDFITRGGWLGSVVLMGDFSVHQGEHNDSNVTLKTFQGGGGWRKSPPSMPKHVFGGHGLLGKTLGDDGRFTKSVGASYEFAPHRVDVGWETSFRLQYDWVIPNGDDNNFQRFSFGGVIRYKKNK